MLTPFSSQNWAFLAEYEAADGLRGCWEYLRSIFISKLSFGAVSISRGRSFWLKLIKSYICSFSCQPQICGHLCVCRLAMLRKIVKTHARAHLLPLHLLKLLSSVAAGQPIQVFINLPLSEISDIDDQHSVSMALRKHVLYVFLTIYLHSVVAWREYAKANKFCKGASI